MRARVLLLFSLGFNIALTAMLFYAGQSWETTFPAATDQSSRTNVGARGLKPNVFVRRQSFVWSDIESTDYPTFIANLRSIGCPEATIRDIIIADINQLYARKRAVEIVTPEQQWWRSEPDPELLEVAAAKQMALEQERRALLTQLLGPNWEVGSNQQSDQGLPLDGPILGKLSLQTKQGLREIEAQSEEKRQAYLGEQEKAGKPPDPAELARMRQLTRNQLAQLLTAEELEEYLLRHSHNAQVLRNELRGFEATPEEFRSIFRARDAVDLQIQMFYSGTDAASVRKREELEQMRDVTVQQTLDPERFQMYKHTQDPLFRQAQASAERIGAPPEKVLPLYQINQATELEKQRILNDLTLTEDEQEAALQDVQREQKKSLRKILGDEAYKNYSQLGPKESKR